MKFTLIILLSFASNFAFSEAVETDCLAMNESRESSAKEKNAQTKESKKKSAETVSQ